VQKFLADLPNTWSVKTQERSIRGIPDLLCCVNGHFVALELKRSVKEQMKGTLQAHILNKIHESGGFASFVFPENWEWVQIQLLRISKGESSGNY